MSIPTARATGSRPSTVPVKLNRPFGGLGERGDPAPARVTAVEDRPAVVQRLLPCLGQRDLGIRPEPDRGAMIGPVVLK